MVNDILTNANKREHYMKKFEKFVKEIGNSFSVNVNKLLQPRDLKVFRLGDYTLPRTGETVDLSEYLIDEEGDLYSVNNDTYFTKYGTRLKQLSNGALDAGGYITNSFRATNGRKVTIRRKEIKKMMLRGALGIKVSFDDLPVVQGKVETKNFSSAIV
jgi:hypothetical protein